MPKKQNSKPEAQLLELLKSILPKAVEDAKLVEKIYSACEQEIFAKNAAQAFESYCKRTELPDLGKDSLEGLKKQFEESFGKGKVSVVPLPEKEAAVVEVVLPNETFEGVIKIGQDNGASDDAEEPEFKPKFVPFPVSLESDPDLIWVMARSENLTPDEGAIALTKLQDDFWASKAGQKLLKNRVERAFPEFISRVPSKLLTEVGLKRHYKDPEPLKQLRVLHSK